MFMFALGALCTPNAFGQTIAPGTSTTIATSHTDASAINVSIIGADGDRWFGVEVLDPDPVTGEPKPGVVFLDTSVPSTDVKFFEPYGRVQAGIYPSIWTHSGTALVAVTGKIDPDMDPSVSDTGAPQLWVYEQDRDNLTAAVSGRDRIIPYAAISHAYEHSRPHISRDPIEPEMFVCYTAKRDLLLIDDEKVSTKAKDASSWTASTLRTVADNTDEIDDHCFMAFNHNGTRYTFYHHDQSGDDIKFEMGTFISGTWSVIGDFELTGSGNCDKPAASVLIDGATTTMFVVAQCATGSEVRLWWCTGAESACDSELEWGLPNTIMSGIGNVLWDPKIIVTDDGTEQDAYVLIENDNDLAGSPSNRVVLFSDCDLAVTTARTGDFTLEGDLPLPAGATIGSQTSTGLSSGNSSSQWYFDGVDLYAAFLVESSTGLVTHFDLAEWTAEPGVTICN